MAALSYVLNCLPKKSSAKTYSLNAMPIRLATVVLSVLQDCPSTTFYLLEVIVNCAMIAEVSVRLLAFGKVRLYVSFHKPRSDSYATMWCESNFGNPITTLSTCVSPYSVASPSSSSSSQGVQQKVKKCLTPFSSLSEICFSLVDLHSSCASTFSRNSPSGDEYCRSDFGKQTSGAARMSSRDQHLSTSPRHGNIPSHSISTSMTRKHCHMSGGH
jgi:hypothetical protein